MVFIDENGRVLKNTSYEQAKNIAKSKGLDLVEVSKDTFKILNKGKWEYTKQKQARKNKQANKNKERKTVRVLPTIGANDLNTKIKHIKNWLEEGRPVYVEMRFKGRMITHREVGDAVVKTMLDEVAELGKTQDNPKMANGNTLAFTILPLKK